jgi:hypothetical protein
MASARDADAETVRVALPAPMAQGRKLIDDAGSGTELGRMRRGFGAHPTDSPEPPERSHNHADCAEPRQLAALVPTDFGGYVAWQGSEPA